MELQIDLIECTHTHTHTHTHLPTKVTLWGFGIQVGDWKLGGAHDQGGGLPWWLSAKEHACQCRNQQFDPWSGKIPYALEQLSPGTAITEPMCPNY